MHTCFGTRLYSSFPRVRVALFHIPCSPSHSSRYTPFDLSEGKVLRKEKKAQITEEILLSY